MLGTAQRPRRSDAPVRDRPGVPVRGDFDGDWKHDIAVYRPSTQTWLLLQSSSGNTSHDTFVFGQPGDLPTPGEYSVTARGDTHRRTVLCVFRPSTGTWLLLDDHNIGYVVIYSWGASADIPLGGQR